MEAGDNHLFPFDPPLITPETAEVLLPWEQHHPSAFNTPVLAPEQVPDEVRRIFLQESESRLRNLSKVIPALETSPHSIELLRAAQRHTHTLKGSAATAGFSSVARIAHRMEDLLDRVIEGSTQLLPHYPLLVEGLEVLESLAVGIVDHQTITMVEFKFAAALGSYHGLLLDSQRPSLDVKNTVGNPFFDQLQRVVQQTSNAVGKPTRLLIDWPELNLTNKQREILSEVLSHLIRNAIDHGIERAETRTRRAKSNVGTIRLKAIKEASSWTITLQDDGGGISWEKVAEIAYQKFLIPTPNVPIETLKKTLFEAGFSTSSRITEISGRGVGLHVVQTALHEIQGTISVESVPQKGTTFTISFPLTTNARGYSSSEYAYSLQEFGTPIFLPNSKGYLLKRPIPASFYEDCCAPYPLFKCQNWAGLKNDLEELNESVVSVVAVMDPLSEFQPTELGFNIGVVPFKQHFIVDLQTPWEQALPPNHKRNAKKASQSLHIEKVAYSPTVLEEWIKLYEHLIERHQIMGIARFSRLAFEMQLQLPDIDIYQAKFGTEVVGMALFLNDEEQVYYHLAAYNETGYSKSAAFGIFWHAFKDYQKEARVVCLGAGAGVNEKEDGLTRFKRGWSTGTRTAYLAKHIANPEVYEELTKQQKKQGRSYFPAYRAER
jgi:signal transduction histidine kinase